MICVGGYLLLIPHLSGCTKVNCVFCHRKWVSNGQLLGMKTMVRDQVGSTQHWSHVTWEEGSSSPRALPGSMVSQASPVVFVNRMCLDWVEVVFTLPRAQHLQAWTLPVWGTVPPVRSPVTYLLGYATNNGYADFGAKTVIVAGIVLWEALGSQKVILLPWSGVLQVWLVLCSPQKPIWRSKVYCLSLLLIQQTTTRFILWISWASWGWKTLHLER